MITVSSTKHADNLNVVCALIAFGCASLITSASAVEPASANRFIEANCLDCHDAETAEGGLNLTDLKLDLGNRRDFGIWVRVHDRVAAGEMPPENVLSSKVSEPFTKELAGQLLNADRRRVESEGRSVVRRLNRREYENTIRDLFGTPWLSIADRLPEDGTAHGFNRSSEALDVAHVHLARYLDAADDALRAALVAQSQPPKRSINRYYARDQERFVRTMNLGGPAMRHPFPVFDGKADDRFIDLSKELNTQVKRAGRHKLLLNATKTPEQRELEAIGVVVSTYEPTEIRFDRFQAPVAGRYRLRLRAYTIWVASRTEWVEAKPELEMMERVMRTFPDFTQITTGRRNEPITLYSDRSPRILRKLGSFDITPQPDNYEMEVWLQAGETIRPDAARLFRPRGAYPINPLAEGDGGMPGVAFQWLEVEGPLGNEANQPAPVKLFDQQTTSTEPLIRRFLRRAYRRDVEEKDVARFVNVVRQLEAHGAPPREAVLGGYKAILCSPGFLYLDEHPGVLDDHALACRLSYFLTNSAPDARLRELADRGELRDKVILRAETERLLRSPKAQRFVHSFLDYWLELRHIGGTSPDGSLYPDYQLDDLLTESMLEETRHFFTELVANDLPSRNLVDSDFAMLNERMATHYGIEDVDGVHFRKVALPVDSLRGGLMTQASVLKVTSDGTTTSPVIRGVWIAERILGVHVPPPPENVGAVEPDTRGATTIREILDRHRNIESCAKCHRQIDPYGFALESFDVMGAQRSQYRAVGGTPIEGGGHNGRPFEFHYGPRASADGQLPSGRPFQDVRELKQLLMEHERGVAANLLNQLIVYATGAPVGFADRDEVESILSRTEANHFGVRTLIHEVVQSRMFRHK